MSKWLCDPDFPHHFSAFQWHSLFKIRSEDLPCLLSAFQTYLGSRARDPNHYTRAWQTCLLRADSYLGFVGHVASVAATQLCFCSIEQSKTQVPINKHCLCFQVINAKNNTKNFLECL